MKNKNFVYITALALGTQLLGACKKELNVNPQSRINLNQYYKTPADAFAALVAVYDRFGFQTGGLYDKLAVMDVAGGDQVAGGGSARGINNPQGMQNFFLSSTSGPEGYLWDRGYAGIYPANVLPSPRDNSALDAATQAR